jgi:hypothetical protein
MYLEIKLAVKVPSSELLGGIRFRATLDASAMACLMQWLLTRVQSNSGRPSHPHAQTELTDTLLRGYQLSINTTLRKTKQSVSSRDGCDLFGHFPRGQCLAYNYGLSLTLLVQGDIHVYSTAYNRSASGQCYHVLFGMRFLNLPLLMDMALLKI